MKRMLALRLISAMRKHVGPFTLPVAFIVLTLINYVDKNNHPFRQIKVKDDIICYFIEISKFKIKVGITENGI